MTDDIVDEDVTLDMESIRDIINGLKADQLLAKRIEERELKELKNTAKEVEDVNGAITIVNIVAQTMQQRVHKQIAKIVSQCLRAVFANSYEFKLEFEKKRNKTEAILVLERDGVEYNDPLNEVGGGVIDIVSFGLRLSGILMSKPLRRRLLVLDEPFRNVRGRDNKKRLRRMLMKLAEEMGFQFVLNVDGEAYPEFVLGKSIELG